MASLQQLAQSDGDDDDDPADVVVTTTETTTSTRDRSHLRWGKLETPAFQSIAMWLEFLSLILPEMT